MLNADKPHLWDDDTRSSVLQYNEWFMDFAPKAYKSARAASMRRVEELFNSSKNLESLTPSLLLDNPTALAVLRMLCAPPIAVDRLAGLADVSNSKIKAMEKESRFPNRGLSEFLAYDIPAMISVIEKLIDRQLMPWLISHDVPTEEDLLVAKSVISDRLCGSMADPLIRNEQEARQLRVIANYLDNRGYVLFEDSGVGAFDMPHGTYAYHKTVSMYKNARDESGGWVNTPVDVVIMPRDSSAQRPLLIECKSAGDFANTNKRRKEEDTKVTQLRATYGNDIILYLFLCGYFDATYLGYEAANHMDWIWEHRIDDFEGVGV